MNTISVNIVTVKTFLLEADIHDKNGEKQEAAKIRGWVADFLSEQSKIVRSLWRPCIL